MTPSCTAALRASTRARLEDLFDADLADVRVHLAAPSAVLAYTEGTDVHVHPSVYGRDDPEGLEILGHEIAHVLQQRHGRVGPTSVRDGVPVNLDPELEREAIAAGRAVARGRRVRIPGRPVGTVVPVRQNYQTVPPANRGAQGVAVQNGAHAPAAPVASSSFVHQDKGAPPSSSFLAAGQPSLATTDPANAILRLSATGEMAVEDADLNARQPKVFYATDAVINASNARLTLFGSKFQLVKDVVGANQRRITVGANILYRVLPQNVTNATAGLAMDAAQQCDALVMDVIGLAAPLSPVPAYEQPMNYPPDPMWEYHTARQLLPPPLPPVLNHSSTANRATTMTAIAGPYAGFARNPGVGFRAQLRQFGINEFAAPAPGEGFVTATLQAVPAGGTIGQGANPPTCIDHYHLDAANNPTIVQSSRTWGTHWAGVVAQDGGDVVTLENYARTAEDALAGNDTRYYFQMYDTSALGAGAGRSWHTQWTTTPMQAAAGPAVGGVYQQATHRPVSPGALSFANPITLRVVLPGGRLDAIAAAIHPNAENVKNNEAQIAAAASADAEIRAVLQGVRYAADHLAPPGRPGRAARITRWVNALQAAAAAARFPSNRYAIAYALARVGQVQPG